MNVLVLAILVFVAFVPDVEAQSEGQYCGFGNSDGLKFPICTDGFCCLEQEYFVFGIPLTRFICTKSRLIGGIINTLGYTTVNQCCTDS